MIRILPRTTWNSSCHKQTNTGRSRRHGTRENTKTARRKGPRQRGRGRPTHRQREGGRESTEWREDGKKRGKRDGMGNKVHSCGQEDRDRAGDSGGWRQTMPCKVPLLSRRPLGEE